MNGEIDKGVTLKIPSPTESGRHAILINFPGLVTNEDKALETFGGLEGLAHHLSNDPHSLPLRLRPDDDYSHPLVGERHPTNGLLLKLTKGSVSGEYSAEVITTISHEYQYSTPSDMQYSSIHMLKPRKVEPVRTDSGQDVAVEAVLLGGGPRGIPRQPLLCVPPVFVEQAHYDYAFQDDTVAPARITKAKTWGAPLIRFLPDQEVPPAAAEPSLQQLINQDIVALVRAALQTRPIWIGSALAEHLGFENRNTIVEALGALTYRFSNGPWRGAYIQRGYDPRKEKGSLIYQVLRYQIPLDWLSKLPKQKEILGGASSSSSYSWLASFQTLPHGRMLSLQLCDMKDDSIVEILQNPTILLDDCSDTTGWISPAAWEQIRKRVRQRFQELVSADVEMVEGGEQSGHAVGLTSLQAYLSQLRSERGAHSDEDLDEDQVDEPEEEGDEEAEEEEELGDDVDDDGMRSR